MFQKADFKMMMNNSKRKGRPTPNFGKLTRPKFNNDKNMIFEGVYGNFRLMHTTASLLGCVVQIKVRDGTTYEGILKTISQQFEVVLEMAHKVEEKCAPPQGVGPAVSNLLASFPFEEGICDKLIFRLPDIVMLTGSNVDENFAVRGGSFTDTEISQRINGGQMQVKELEPWEGGASDSENTALGVEEEEDGANGWDANDMFRTNAEKYGVKSSYDNSLQEYTVALTKKDTADYKLKEARASKIALEIESKNDYQSRILLENGDEEDRFSAVVRTDENPSKYVLPQKRRHMPGLPKRQVAPSSVASPVHSKPYQPPHAAGAPPAQGNSKPYAPLQHVRSSPPPLAREATTVNGEGLTEEAPVKPYVLPQSSQTLPPRIERRRESERKQKGRNDEIEEFRKFSSNFKLTEESKESIESREDFAPENKSDSTLLANQLAEQCKLEKDAEEKTTDISKSTLNPNAKEFVFNPNAKAFTPRSMAAPQRIQTQSPVIVMPHSQMMPQPLFTAVAPPQYVMQPFAASLAQPQRFRKVPLTMQPRHDLAPSVHVAAATGQPILAPAATPSQLTMQYASPQGVIHASGPPQQTMGYPQMNFVVGPRVVSPQPVPVAPTSHSVSYCDSSHLPAHLINKYCFPVHPGAGTPQHSGHPPQSQTPVLHPAPSPVHQAPPTTVMYQTGPMGQHPMQAAHHPMHHHHHHPGAFSAGPQPVVLMAQQQQQVGQQQPSHHGAAHPLHMHQVHQMSAGGHMGGPAHLVPQMTIIPTSAPMVPTTIATPPFAQHPQGV